MTKKSNNINLSFIDLFAGIGGFRIALEKHGAKCVFSSEIDLNCKKVYSENFNETPSGDITKIDVSEIPNFDILTAGFPCQPFSYSGRLEGFNDLTRGTLFFDIAKIISEKKPKMFLLENVKGIISHDKGRTLSTIIEVLSGLNYDLHWTILNSHDFGVPQSRERWYCVGFDKKTDFQFPSKSLYKPILADIIDIHLNDPNLKLTKFEMSRINHHFNSNQIRVQHDSSKYDPKTKKGKYGVYSFLKPDNTLRFHVGDYSKTQIQEAYYSSLKSVAPAIIATREPKLWDLGRRLSVTECMRLQGFPQGYKFNVSDRQAKRQLGNSVTIPVIEKIFLSMISAYLID